MTSFQNGNVVFNDQGRNVNLNQKDNINFYRHKSMNNSYDQKHGHPNYDNGLLLDDNGRDFFRSESNWNNSEGYRSGRFEGFDNNNQGSSNHRGFNSFTNRGFKSKRNRWCIENTNENWNKVPQDSSPNIINGPLPISLQCLKIGRNQLHPFNEQNGYAHPSGPPTYQSPSLCQMPPITLPNGGLPQGLPPSITSAEVWVETKASDGKSYYYNARTRKTTWNKPSGPNINVISQEQMHLGNSNFNEFAKPNDQTTDDIVLKNIEDKAHDNDQVALMHPPNVKIPPLEGVPGQMMPPMMGPPPGMIPPNMMIPPPNVLPYVGPPPFGMPPPQAPQAAPWGIVASGYVPSPMMMSGMELNSVIDSNILKDAAEWSEHYTSDGRMYYYSNKTKKSVWGEPEVLRNLDVTRKVATAKLRKKSEQKAEQKSDPQMYTSFPPKMMNHSNSNDGLLKRKDKELYQEANKKTKIDANSKTMNKIIVKDKTRPVSSTHVAGTLWCVVWTGDGRVFYYKPSAKMSVWKKPDDLKGNADVDKMISNPPKIVQALKGTMSQLSTKATKSNSASQENTNNIKNDTEFKVNSLKDSTMESELRAARERAVVPLDIRITQFREMLSEKQVSAFNTWENELHKVVFDPRYLLLASKERKYVFEKYLKELADEERQEKRNKMKMSREAFRQLLEEANLSTKTSFSEFSSKNFKDKRYTNIDKRHERERLFNKYMVELMKQEKKKTELRHEQARKQFKILLKEHSEIDCHTRWHEIKNKLEHDSRYKDVDSSVFREDYFIDYVRSLTNEMQKEKEREHEEKDKYSHKRDKHDEEEEESSSKTESKQDENSPEKQKEESKDLKEARIEASLKEREKRVQDILAVHLKRRENEQRRHKLNEAVVNFNALLTDLIKSNNMSWKEAKRQLRKDSRYELADQLDFNKKKKLYEVHVEELSKRKKEKFREMINEISDLNLDSSWKEIKKLIEEDVRYVRFSSSDRKCEKEFRAYLEDKVVTAKNEFKNLLRETKLITHLSNSKLEEDRDRYLKKVEDMLCKDKRYLFLDSIADERSELIVSYIEELEKSGPPHPPTATEPTPLWNKF